MGTRVLKASGRVEDFSEEKVVRSLVNVGVPPPEAREIAAELSATLGEVASTATIYEQLYAILRRRHPRHAMKYALRRAIMRLGPEGFPFEKYFAEILRRVGYRVKTNVVMRGRCDVLHEVDIVAERDGLKYLVECKYHNAPGIYTGLKTVLYVKARLDSLNHLLDRAWVATNTKVSEEAVAYARCMGIRLTAWKYPPGEGLESLVEKTGLYPVTILPIGERARRRLLTLGIVSVEDVLRLGPNRLRGLTGLGAGEVEQIYAEARFLEK